jgi:two-component system, OmpR family, alkaline phosphatase synthesis response regulator PhoP
MSAGFPRCRTLADTHSRILIVEDDGDIAALIAHYLDKAGYAWEIAADGSRGLASARDKPPDLVILDLMLPGLNGLEVCRALRQNNRTAALPIIMLTARGEESERILGLDSGADDYIVKPFSPNELMARVRALLRRVSAPATNDRVLQCGPISVDVERHTVLDAGETVRLTAKEFLLLQYLLEHRGRVLSRDRLLSDVWDYQYPGATRTVDVHVRRLREKLPYLEKALVTVQQFGYKLAEP